ncbi:hypothetical protein HYZ41_04415 [archaeon]|nr:hypothetical protein [archaeon]
MNYNRSISYSNSNIFRPDYLSVENLASEMFKTIAINYVTAPAEKRNFLQGLCNAFTLQKCWDSQDIFSSKEKMYQKNNKRTTKEQQKNNKRTTKEQQNDKEHYQRNVALDASINEERLWNSGLRRRFAKAPSFFKRKKALGFKKERKTGKSSQATCEAQASRGFKSLSQRLIFSFKKKRLIKRK